MQNKAGWTRLVDLHAYLLQRLCELEESGRAKNRLKALAPLVSAKAAYQQGRHPECLTVLDDGLAGRFGRDVPDLVDARARDLFAAARLAVEAEAPPGPAAGP